MILAMGIGIALAVGLALTAASAGAAFFLLSQVENDNPNDMSPNSLDDFGNTQAKEGAVIPLCYGRVRIPGNILYFGNLNTTPIREKVEGGKGTGKSKKVITGYRYYIDIWYALAEATMTVIETYVAGKKEAIEATDFVFNNGTETDFPSWVGAFASKLPGICHIGYEQQFIGENISFLPSIHFVLQKTLPTTVDYANMTNGSNPAAILYDLLTVVGEVPPSDIDLDSFNSAAEYWFAKGYGLNLVFNSRQDWGNLVKQILGFVDGAMYPNNEGKYTLRAFNPQDVADRAIKTHQFIDFTFSRQSYYDTKNFFQGEYKSRLDDYSTRAVQSQNPANINAVGVQQQSVDLSAYSDLTAASKRIWEINKINSFPKASLEFSTDLEFSDMARGEVLQVTHTDYALIRQNYRVTSVDYSEIDSNIIKWKAEQMVEQIVYNEEFLLGDESIGSGIEVPLVNLSKRQVFEMPYTETGGHNPVYLMLAARESNETGFQVLFSPDDQDYKPIAEITGYSQYGTLVEEYSEDTYWIDDDIGILYTPFREDPVFPSVSRVALFVERRVAIIGTEIMAFQTVTPEGVGSDIRLTGVVRGLFNTKRQTHPAGSPIWLAEPDYCKIEGIVSAEFYLKFVPYFFDTAANEFDMFDIFTIYGGKARRPEPPGRVQAVRTGSTVDFTVWPVLYHYPENAAGYRAPSQRDTGPTDTPFDSFIRIYISASPGFIGWNIYYLRG
jgi:hypothetical protein